ncbi:hypothetical protein [Methylocystis sp. ATCC 49242]|uniref:hypothetical protein n=1 Tax=Methylocystis sp. ATCC 49242 TaxID=622637 RepID=UPI0001F8882E|nr:hypothetical protein [Methylocystis sp. ATCC 49242]
MKGEGLAFRDQAQPQFYTKAAEVTLQTGKKCFTIAGQQTFDGAVEKPVTTHVGLFGVTQTTASVPTKAYAGDIQMFDKCDGSQIDAASVPKPKS